MLHHNKWTAEKSTMPALVRAYVGLGSNLADPIYQLRQAFAELDAIPDTSVVSISGLYRSAPVGPQNQADFINAAVSLDTQQSAINLLKHLLDIEQQHGRDRSVGRWGPRTLDLDLLLFGADILQEESLIVPHPAMHERSFVLIPLAEIAPEIIIPGRGKVDDLAQRCNREGIETVDSVHSFQP